jgi:ubiquinone/menaquinone biosynthesis C-methylase UbiE
VTRVRQALLGGVASWLALRVWAAMRPTAFPYFARPILDFPRPFITRAGLVEVLAPQLGERILELGPGTGYYTLPVAERIGSQGTLDILDIRQSFLDDALGRACRGGFRNVVATCGDARSLPNPDDSFDAAYLVSVLGEISDQVAALHELQRVLKPDGRLVIGEIFIDPDFPRFAWLVKRSRAAGFRLERRAGTPFAYFAEFRVGSTRSTSPVATRRRAT